MPMIKASDFKARCLKLMDHVARTGESVVITKHGRPVSRLVPFRRQPRTLFGLKRGTLSLNDDLIAPIDADWEALE